MTTDTDGSGSKRKGGVRLVLLTGTGIVLLYLTGFHGEYHSSDYEDGLRFTKTQYFVTWKVYETKGSEPPGLPERPPSLTAQLGETRSWRGFGLVWQRTKHYR